MQVQHRAGAAAVGAMTETPFFFTVDDLSLFGVFHAPSGDPVRLPYVFCHPFGEEKLWTHRAWVSFARELSRRGHPVLRFDLRGNGDSEGDFADATIATARRDTAATIDVARRRTGADRVGLLGLRLGAAVATLVADERTDVAELILWSPIVNGNRFAQDLLRVNLATQMTLFREVQQDRAALVAQMRAGQPVNVDGYPMSLDAYEQLCAVDLAAAARTYAHRCLVVQVERAAGRPLPELVQLTAGFQAGTHLQVQEEPFWKEIDRFYEEAPNLTAATLAWLEAA
jgi:uncharacterized protein